MFVLEGVYVVEFGYAFYALGDPVEFVFRGGAGELCKGVGEHVVDGCGKGYGFQYALGVLAV